MFVIMMRKIDGNEIRLIAIRKTLGDARTVLIASVYDLLSNELESDFDQSSYTQIEVHDQNGNNTHIFEIIEVEDYQ